MKRPFTVEIRRQSDDMIVHTMNNIISVQRIEDMVDDYSYVKVVKDDLQTFEFDEKFYRAVIY